MDRFADNLDSIARGALSGKNGACIGLPFYVRFETRDEAYEYAKKHLEPFKFLKHPVCVIWDSPIGEQLISTLVLSPRVRAFYFAYGNLGKTVFNFS